MSSTVHVPAGQISGLVIQSDDSRLPVGTQVGLRLADFEGISEPSAAVNGMILPIQVLAHDRAPDQSSTVTFVLV